jgi:lysyl-tRNA synthetase class 2
VLTLDVAPRRRDAPNGIVERLIVETVRYGRERGVREVSLNFAGMRQVFTASGRLARLAAAAVHVFDRWIELRPLYRFTAKFDPRWRPRSLLLRSWCEVGPVGVAALVAEFGGTGGGADPVPELAEQPAPA